MLSPERIGQLQDLVLRVPAADHVLRYAVRICRLSRPATEGAPPKVREYISWGAGPRASLFLVLAAKAKTLLEGRYAVRIEDIQALVPPVLQHRLVRNFHAEAEGVTTVDVIEQLLAAVRP